MKPNKIVRFKRLTMNFPVINLFLKVQFVSECVPYSFICVLQSALKLAGISCRCL